MQVVLLLSVAALCHFASAHNATALDSLVSAIGKASTFLKNEYKYFNLDGILGFMALLGQIRGTIKKWSLKEELQGHVIKLKEMEKDLSDGITKSLKYLEEDNALYFKCFKRLLNENFWILPTSWKKTNRELVYPTLNKTGCLPGHVSNLCITLLLGTWKESVESCVAPELCIKNETKPGCTDYQLSHQLFYLMIGRMNRCQHSLFNEEFSHYSAIFCANMMKKNLEIELNGYLDGWQDLFMENIMFCSLSEYSDFNKLEWMEKIISWQDSCGCFKSQAKNRVEKENKPSRFKRTEKRMSDGCLSHKTCVAAAALEEIKGINQKTGSKLDMRRLPLKRMENLLHFLINKATYYVKKTDPHYFNDFKELISDHFWILPSSWNKTNPDLEYSQLEISDCLTENISDECIALLLGTWDDSGETCVVTESCKKLVTKSGCTDFSLSHQLLYLLVGKMKRCTDSLFVQEYTHYSNVFCANMIKRNLEIEWSGYPLSDRDLFMENILLCGFAQYSDIYDPGWMDAIISWQDPSGCFGYTDKDLGSLIANLSNTRRFKRREKLMSGSCLSHMTSVAVGALGGYLYYFEI